MTFSNGEVVKRLNEGFVCAWVNRRPDLRFKDGLYGPSWRPRNLENGSAVTNVTAVFATPDGTVVHAMPGYLDAPAFLRHLEFAKSLAARMFAPSVRAEDRGSIYADAHAKASKQSGPYPQSDAHRRLAKKLMKANEMPFTFFDELGNVFA